MKLSDAIMLNGMTKPQGRKVYSFRSVDSPCALGGALQSIGKSQTYDNLHAEWPWLKKSASCPACDRLRGTYGTRVIWHLNDMHEWTRQQIAEWVQSVEPQEPTYIGVDLAGGPELTVFTCTKCGSSEVPCEHYEVVNELP